MRRALNPFLCGDIIHAAWLCSERSYLWDEKVAHYRPSLEHAAQVLAGLRATWQACQPTGNTYCSLPHPDPLSDLLVFYTCKDQFPELRHVGVEVVLDQFHAMLTTLAAGTALSKEDSDRLQRFFVVLSRLTTRYPEPCQK